MWMRGRELWNGRVDHEVAIQYLEQPLDGSTSQTWLERENFKKKKTKPVIQFLSWLFFFWGVCYVWVQVVRVANKTTRLSSHRCDAEMAKGGKRNTAEKTKDRWERSVTGRGQQWPWVYLQCDIENLSVNVVGKNGRLHQRLLITCFGSNNPPIIRIEPPNEIVAFVIHRH